MKRSTTQGGIAGGRGWQRATGKWLASAMVVGLHAAHPHAAWAQTDPVPTAAAPTPEQPVEPPPASGESPAAPAEVAAPAAPTVTTAPAASPAPAVGVAPAVSPAPAVGVAPAVSAAPAAMTPTPVAVTGAAPGVGMTASQAAPQPHKQATEPRGTYFQLRALGLFGLNSTHQFASECPVFNCAVTTPVGGAVGAAVGWEKRGWAVEVLGLFLMDNTRTRYKHPETRTVQVPVAEASGSGSAGAGASGNGGIDIDIGPDGISIGGSLGGSAGGSGSGSGAVKTEERRVTEVRSEKVDVLRRGFALGVGVRRNFGRRPARLTTALTGGVLFRTVSSSLDSDDDSTSNYRAPFIMADVGFVLGKRGGFHLGLVGMVEFPKDVWLVDYPGVGSVQVIDGPQYFLGPMLAVQWGPRTVPRPPRTETER